MNASFAGGREGGIFDFPCMKHKEEELQALEGASSERFRNKDEHPKVIVQILNPSIF